MVQVMYYNIIIICCATIIDRPVNLNSLLLRLKGDLTSHWHVFGLAIGIPKHILVELKSYPSEQRLVEVLDYWLKHSHGQPTWQQVLEAQEKVKFHQIAQNLVLDFEDTHNGRFITL